MKRINLAISLVLILSILVSCSDSNVQEYVIESEDVPYQLDNLSEPEEYIDKPEEDCEPVDDLYQIVEPDEPERIEVPFCVNQAARYLATITAIWDADDGQLWGFHLHEPLIIVCEVTRNVTANKPDEEGLLEQQSTAYGDVYVGLFPSEEFIGNTAITWGGRTWGMATWQLLQYRAHCEAYQMRLLAHEGFHATQMRIWGRMGAFPIPHGRATSVSMYDEIQALGRAWSNVGDERLEAIQKALEFRELREGREGNPFFETQFEFGEGLAVYTELRLVLHNRDEIDNAVADLLMWAEETLRMDITFGYVSGALYALLLSDMGVTWKDDLTHQTEMASVLREYLSLP